MLWFVWMKYEFSSVFQINLPTCDGPVFEYFIMEYNTSTFLISTKFYGILQHIDIPASNDIGVVKCM